MIAQCLAHAMRAMQEETKKIDNTLLKHVVDYDKFQQKLYSPQKQPIINCRIVYQICKICKELGDKGHHDVYVEIFISSLLPCWETSADDCKIASHWSTFLLYTENLYRILVNAKRYKEADDTFRSLVRLTQKLRNPDDYKYFLNIYGLHFHYVVCGQQVTTDGSSVLDAFEELFSNMLRDNIDRKFEYPDVLDYTQKSLFYDNRRADLECLMKPSPDKFMGMFEALLKLLQMQQTSAKPTDVVKASFQSCTKAFHSLLLCDQVTSWELQLSSRFLKMCHETSHFAAVKEISDFCGLLYNYIKLTCAPSKIVEFNSIYCKVASKVLTFFEKATPIISQENWLQHALLAFMAFFATSQPLITHESLTPFWLQMNNAEVQLVLNKIIAKCVSLAESFEAFETIGLPCCSLRPKDAASKTNETWKHFLSSCVVYAMTAISFFYKYSDEEACAQPKIAELHAAFGGVFQKLVEVVRTSKCSALISGVLQNLEALLVFIMQSIQNPQQSQFFLSMGEKLLPLKAKFAANDWKNLISCFAKIAEKTNNSRIIGDYKCCYIATLLLTLESSEATANSKNAIQRQLYELSRMENIADPVCCLEIYENSSNVLKPCLNKLQKRSLHWFDLQNFFKYCKSTERSLLMSLGKFCQSAYQYVVLCEVNKTLLSEPKFLEKLRHICGHLKTKQSEKVPTTHIEELTLGHALAAIFFEDLQQRKSSYGISEPLREEYLFKLMASEKFQASFSVSLEWKWISSLVEALEAFKAFFKKADDNSSASQNAKQDVDYVCLLETLAEIATHFNIGGYTDKALETWVLHYEVSKKIGDKVNRIRALASLCEPSSLVRVRANFCLDVEQALAENECNLIDLIKDIQTQRHGHQNYALICLAQVAFHKACWLDDAPSAQVLLKLGRFHHSRLESRLNKYDTVQLTFDLVELRIMTRRLKSAVSAKSLIQKMSIMLDNVRGLTNFAHADKLYAIQLLFQLFHELASSAAGRLYNKLLDGWAAVILKYAIDHSAALRAVLLLTTSANLCLQSENVKRAEEEIQLAELVLGLKTYAHAENIENTTKQTTCKKKKAVPIQSRSFLNRDTGCPEKLEVVRDGPRSPRCVTKLEDSQDSSTPKMRSGPNHLKWIFFALKNSKILEFHMAYQWVYFTMACLKARICFLKQEYGQLEEFYRDSKNWIQEQNQSGICHCIERIDVIMLIAQHHVNLLRKLHRFEDVFECLQGMPVLHDDAWQSHYDAVHLMNLRQQFSATRSAIQKAEMARVAEAMHRTLGLPTGIRRKLDFPLSPTPAVRQQGLEEALSPKNGSKQRDYYAHSDGSKLGWHQYLVPDAPNVTVGIFETSSTDGDASFLANKENEIPRQLIGKIDSSVTLSTNLTAMWSRKETSHETASMMQKQARTSNSEIVSMPSAEKSRYTMNECAEILEEISSNPVNKSSIVLSNHPDNKVEALDDVPRKSVSKNMQVEKKET